LRKSQILQLGQTSQQVRIECAQFIRRQVQFDEVFHQKVHCAILVQIVVQLNVSYFVVLQVQIAQFRVHAVKYGPVDEFDLVEAQLDTFEISQIAQTLQVGRFHIYVLQTYVHQRVLQAHEGVLIQAVQVVLVQYKTFQLRQWPKQAIGQIFDSVSSQIQSLQAIKSIENRRRLECIVELNCIALKR